MRENDSSQSTTVSEGIPYEVLGNLLLKADLTPTVGKSSCDVIYSLNKSYVVLGEGMDFFTNQTG